VRRRSMTDRQPPLGIGHILIGPLFNEPMRVETVQSNGAASWAVGLVGTNSERFRKVTITAEDLQRLTVLDPKHSFSGDGRLLRLGLQAYALGIAYEFDPYFGLSISRVDPLPHQLEAIYDYLLKLARVRFLLADDAGAAKTIMSGLLIRELELRGLVAPRLLQRRRKAQSQAPALPACRHWQSALSGELQPCRADAARGSGACHRPLRRPMASPSRGRTQREFPIPPARLSLSPSCPNLGGCGTSRREL
jgi:hypothetical protein